MKSQALFSSKDKNKKLKCHLLQFLFGFAYKIELFLPKQSPKCRSVLEDGSRYFGLFRKGKTRIIAKRVNYFLVKFTLRYQ